MQRSQIASTLLKNRGLTTPSAIDEFFNPKEPLDLASPFKSQPAIQLIKQHITKKNKIYIYGDYDVDGICATAILWETLYSVYKGAAPFIPHRRQEGYGLSKAGIDSCIAGGAKLIIVVDSGIVAHEQIDYCKSQGCDVIIIDHHEPTDILPHPNVLLHSTITSAAGLAWFFCRDFLKSRGETIPSDLLSLVAISVVCDIVPLLGVNRSLVKHGLEKLKLTTRPGLLALFEEAGLKANDQQLTTYHVGYVIGPRLNSMGRLGHAIDSLRLLCTKDPLKAQSLAKMLGDTNRARQKLTVDALTLAESTVSGSNDPSLIIVDSPSFDEGVIGLIAAKLTEKYYRPTIAISVGAELSKGSARSIAGFHITDFLREHSHLFVAVGGHAMASGFTIKTSNLEKLKSTLVIPDINPEILIKKSRVDMEISLQEIDNELHRQLLEFEPFGLGNPTPVFKSQSLVPTSVRRIGQAKNHLKFSLDSFDVIYFNYPPDKEFPLTPQSFIYQIDENTYNGRTNLQLKIVGIES